MSTISSRLPPIHCLLAFEARARLESGVLVAQELAITPSAVSHRIRQLEEFTRLQLFSKINGKTVLTAAGQSYLETVRGALHALSHFSEPRGPAPRPRARLRLSSPPTFAAQILVPRLATIRMQFPQLEIDIQLSVPLVGTKAEPADIEIRFGDGKYPGRQVTPILDEPIFPVCSPSYRDANGPFASPGDLADARLLRCSIEPWHPWLQAAGLDWPEPGSDIHFSDVGLFVEAAAHGHGVALARTSLAASLLAQGKLVRLFALSAQPYYAYYATCLPEACERAEVQGFLEWLECDLRPPPAFGPDAAPPLARPWMHSRRTGGFAGSRALPETVAATAHG